MSHKVIPSKFKSLLELIRFNRPIGFFLLMWPCWFALASLPVIRLSHLKWYFLFIIGSFLMRSAGCIINDLIDINLDKKVKRTSQRPLVIKSVSFFESISLLALLLFFALLVLIQFNTKTIILIFLSLPLVILYPLMKRITNWPQLVLGVVYNWGVLIVSMQFNGYLTSTAIILYAGCIFWTLGYDTIYAYQDRKDDIKINIKSTAILFDNNGKKFVQAFYTIFLMILGYIAFYNSSSITSILVLIPFLIAMILFLNKWIIKSKSSSNYYFKINNYFGLLCFIYLIIF
jgi:4-hydroxybenzoate polyprenyl transferase